MRKRTLIADDLLRVGHVHQRLANDAQISCVALFNFAVQRINLHDLRRAAAFPDPPPPPVPRPACARSKNLVFLRVLLSIGESLRLVDAIFIERPGHVIAGHVLLPAIFLGFPCIGRRRWSTASRAKHKRAVCEPAPAALASPVAEHSIGRRHPELNLGCPITVALRGRPRRRKSAACSASGARRRRRRSAFRASLPSSIAGRNRRASRSSDGAELHGHAGMGLVGQVFTPRMLREELAGHAGHRARAIFDDRIEQTVQRPAAAAAVF